MLAETRKRAKILIVDDQEQNVRLLERLLQHAGYTMLESSTDSRLVLPLFSEFQTDLILLDLTMPHLDGFGVMRELAGHIRSEEHTSELQSHLNLVCRLLLEKKKKI